MDLKEIRQLVRFLAGTDVKEIEIKEEGGSVRISRAVPGEQSAPLQPTTVFSMAAPVAMAPPAAASAPVAATAQQAAPRTRTQDVSEFDDDGDTMIVTSPMVGTYYQASSPDSPAFVAKGDIVRKGQVVCIVEAMKLMNEIESEYSGRVIRIAKENASPVEYGEALFVLEPV